MKTFGEYIKSLRISREITLRDFCKIINVDPSNWSKVERGINPPPKSKEILEEIGKALNLDTTSEEFKSICDLAALSYIPKELISDKELLEMLPAFFRTSRGEKPLKEELDKLIKIIKEE
jgi:transcriptional regulator with XRE-family HTH domain